jgi:hypothetical protein
VTTDDFTFSETPRKLLLQGCAAGRAVAHALPEFMFMRMIQLAEQRADGTAPRGASLEAGGNDYSSLSNLLWKLGKRVTDEQTAAARVVMVLANRGPGLLPLPVPTLRAELDQAASAIATAYRDRGYWLGHFQALFADILARPDVTFDPSWRTNTAVTLARHVYEAREFSAMPILADALQDAGCENADILGHCRDPNGVHVRGCWVVDLVLGKG